MNDETILGYRADGTPIYPTKIGTVVTQAFIICTACNGAIKSNSGPAFGSMCKSCWDKGYRSHGNS